jgi:divalent metal cation (Fe/Co/Zn/Cd) transporter
VVEIKRVTVHFKQIALLTAEIVIKVDESMSVKASKDLATRLQDNIKKEIDVVHAEIHLDLGSEDYTVQGTDSRMIDMPPFNSRGQAQVKLAGM